MDGTFVTFAREELITSVAAAEERAWLVSPYLTAPIAARICDAVATASAVDRRLLTAMVPRSVQAGVLSTTGLSGLLNSGFEIASIPNLHAKVCLVDSDWGLVGSGNLTGTGLGGEEGGNLELGVRLSSTQRAEAAELFAHWWTKAKPVGAEEIAGFAALPKFTQAQNLPPEIGRPLALAGSQGLAEVLAEDAARAAGRRYWIKSNYHRPDDAQWWHRNWISDWRQGPYAVGDLIVIYLGARNDGPKCCPAVVEVTSMSRRDPDWVRTHRDAGAADRWPYVTQTAVVGEVPLEAGAKLSLIGKSGRSVQGGYCSISRAEFVQMAREMLAKQQQVA